MTDQIIQRAGLEISSEPAWLQADYSLTDTLSITAGGRYSKDEKSIEYRSRSSRSPNSVVIFDISTAELLAGGVPGSAGAVFQIQNAGDARYRGAELEWDWIPSEPLALYAGLGLMDAEYTSIRAESPLTTQTEPVRAPSATGYLGASYIVPLTVLGGRMTVGGDASFTDSHWVTAANNPEASHVPSHWLYQAQLAYESTGGDWTANLSCRNCADEEYITSWFVGPYLGEPRRWELRLGHRFN